MNSLWSKIESILPFVEKPVRYINNEWNSKRKAPLPGDLIFALAYPDVYEVGMSNMGLQILYEILGNQKHVAAERVYAPWVDMETKMREKGIPLFTLENHYSVSDCDIFGFTLQHEMTFTNVLNMLDLANIPLLAKDRKGDYPFIVGGGPCVFNPEPIAPFFDFFAVGDGEDLILDIVDVIKKQKDSGAGKQETLKALADISGVYVPSLYEVNYHSSGVIKDIYPLSGKIPKIVTKRLVNNLDEAKFPVSPVVPFTQVIHDRCSLEIARGCARGCRFCQAGMIYRPVRERSLEKLKSLCESTLKNTGYEEISLASLSSSDYKKIDDLLRDLVELYGKKGIAISLPSLRMDTFSVKLAEQIQQVKKTGFTFAPEAGTQRLRDVINKNLTEEDIFSTVEAAFKNGWRRLKLYFMIGLPTETPEDLMGIVKLVDKIVESGLKIIPRNERGRFKINVSISSFIPKPHTPFQWVEQNSLEQLVGKQDFLKKHLRGRHVSLKWHEAKSSVIEGVLARGDRRIAKVIKKAWKLGCKFDAWMEYFDYSKWREALKEEDFTIDFYAYRERSMDEVLPWHHISPGVSKKYLQSEYKKALKQKNSGDCRFGPCNGCGVCELADSCPPPRLPTPHDPLRVGGQVAESLEPRDGSMELKGQNPTAKTQQPIHRLRIKYGKTGRLKFISHLDFISTLERSLRRANFPLVLTKGFSPRVKLSYGPPLSVGISSESEYADIFLSKRLSLKEIVNQLNLVLPDGLRVYQAKYIPLSAPSIMKYTDFAEYRIEIEVSSLSLNEMRDLIKRLLFKKELKFLKKEKEKVLSTKEAVLHVKIEAFESGKVTLDTLLSIGGLGGIKPEVLIKLLFDESKFVKNYKVLNIHRVGLYAKINDKFYSPIGKKLG